MATFALAIGESSASLVPPNAGSMAGVKVARQNGGVSPNGLCGAGSSGWTCKESTFGNCCSGEGYCGSSPAYCAQGCQLGFGDCTVTEPSTRSTSSSTASPQSGFPVSSTVTPQTSASPQTTASAQLTANSQSMSSLNCTNMQIQNWFGGYNSGSGYQYLDYGYICPLQLVNNGSTSWNSQYCSNTSSGICTYSASLLVSCDNIAAGDNIVTSPNGTTFEFVWPGGNTTSQFFLNGSPFQSGPCTDTSAASVITFANGTYAFTSDLGYCYLPSGIAASSVGPGCSSQSGRLLLSMGIYNILSAAIALFLGHESVKRRIPRLPCMSESSKWGPSAGLLTVCLQIFGMLVSTAIARANHFQSSFVSLFMMWFMRPRFGFFMALLAFVSPQYAWTWQDVNLSEDVLNLIAFGLALTLRQQQGSNAYNCQVQGYSPSQIRNYWGALDVIIGIGVLSGFPLAWTMVRYCAGDTPGGEKYGNHKRRHKLFSDPVRAAYHGVHILVMMIICIASWVLWYSK